ncbi:MAG TPA: PEP-CTERM sorting domain-containing protein [Phycisphaerae bacterium]|nr:PEP-CTERM sorting domain-containing protein [Phycisphaerae bacterium]
MKRILGVTVMMCAVAGAASADILFDQGPGTGSDGGCWSNYTGSQNFADQYTPAGNEVLQGIDIWTCISAPGGDMHIKILDDNGAGDPGNYLYQWDQSETSIVPDAGLYKYSFDFGDIALNAGVTYWIGVSGNGYELGQESVVAPGDGYMAQFSGPNFDWHTGVGDQMFVLRGIPEPASLALLGLGMALLRRR